MWNLLLSPGKMGAANIFPTCQDAEETIRRSALERTKTYSKVTSFDLIQAFGQLD